MRYFEVLAKLPLPESKLDSAEIEQGAIKIAKEFREKFLAYAEKLKIVGAMCDGDIKKSRPPRETKPADRGPALPAPVGSDEPETTEEPQPGDAPPWNRPAAVG